MFKHYFVLFVALASLTVIAFAKQYKLTGTFKERRSAWGKGYITGTLYYLYDSDAPQNSRLRCEYNINSTFTVANLYHYADKAMYSMCSKCTGVRMKEEAADPWWYVEGLYTKSSGSGKKTTYKRVNASSSTQINQIVITEGATEPSEGYLKNIKFSDGRQLEITSVSPLEDLLINDPKFIPAENCPSPSCPIYADIIFVLDSSGSVNNKEWAQSVKFVGQIMDYFTFGKKGVAAAVVQFAGQTRYTRTKTIYNDSLCGNKSRFYADSGWPNNESHPKIVEWPDIMWSVLASEDYGEGETVSYNKDQLMANLRSTLSDSCFMCGNDCQAFPHGPRGTCQALGLKAAVDMLDRSPRAKNFTSKPNRIVIVVTDGEEKFPNSTESNATLLKQQGTLLIEVGVGLACEYDKNYLKSIASKLGSDDSVAYYDVNKYDKILETADKMFRPICDSNFSDAGCGPDCGAFCGCGFCLCPTCDVSSDTCHFIQCTENHQISKGCETLETKYEIEDDKCVTWKCDATKKNETTGKKGYWYPYVDPCTENRTKNPGECREVYCDSQFGGCRVEINTTYCDQFSNACEKYECAPAGEAPDNPVTGCRLAKNYTQTCIDSFGSKANAWCFEIVCDPNGDSSCDKMLIDKCVERNNACEHYACTFDEKIGDYDCIGTHTRHHVNTSCVEWKCDYNGTEGWVVALDRDEDDYCQNFFNVSKNISSTCRNFYCNPDIDFNEGGGGCYYENRTGCSAQCSVQKEDECMDYGFSNSTNENCIFDFCYVKLVGDDFYIPVCASEMNQSKAENCLANTSKAAKRAKELNEAYPDQCWTPVCKRGGCGYEAVPLKPGFNWNNCTEPRCELQEDGSWDWVMRNTTLMETCLSDACFIRECVPDKGCVKTDNCVKFSNECEKYTCVLNNVTNLPERCELENLTLTFRHLECFDESCVDGKKVTRYPDCVPDDKCYKGVCVNGRCEYEHLPPPGDDICFDWKCVNGTWSEAIPKCVDTRYCTEDECWNYGTFIECHFNQIDCNDYIQMQFEDGRYDCFRARCYEPTEEGQTTFTCKRKIIKGAYIDICGRCIQDDPYAEYSEVQSTSSSEKNAGLICTGAGPKPLMVEALAAGTIGLIIIAAVVVGAAFTTSSIVATKSLIDRVKDASNQSAQSNPLFEGVETELQNPTYAGGVK